VDSAEPRDLAQARELFGETPVTAITPSGGAHLYYRHNGEGRRIRPFGKALPVDILGSGLAVCPPSVREASSDKSAGRYSFLEGSPVDFPRLPIIPAGSIPNHHNAQAHANSDGVDVEAMREGDGRNNKLFRIARDLAQQSGSENELCEAVCGANAKFGKPLSLNEAQAVARKAWGYKISGRLIANGVKSGGLQEADFARCASYPIAALLLAYLRMHHAEQHLFAIVPDGLAAKLGVSKNTVRRAREYLIEAGYLALERRGGLFGGNQVASLYRFAP